MAPVPALSDYKHVTALTALEQMIRKDLGCSEWRVVD